MNPNPNPSRFAPTPIHQERTDDEMTDWGKPNPDDTPAWNAENYAPDGFLPGTVVDLAVEHEGEGIIVTDALVTEWTWGGVTYLKGTILTMVPWDMLGVIQRDLGEETARTIRESFGIASEGES